MLVVVERARKRDADWESCCHCIVVFGGGGVGVVLLFLLLVVVLSVLLLWFGPSRGQSEGY